MITPDTIENVLAPNLTGNWLFCKLNAYGYRKLVLAKTEEAFKKSALKCAWDIGSPADRVSMFGMAPHEITIVSFPKERVEQAAKTIKEDQFFLLKKEVLWNVREYQKKFKEVPPGFVVGYKPKGTDSILLYEEGYERDSKAKIWFVGTRKEFEKKFKLPNRQNLKPRGGFPSKAQQPTSGDIFVVSLDSWDKAFNTETMYNETSGLCPSVFNPNILFWFQKGQERQDLRQELVEARAVEIKIAETQDQKRELDRILKYDTEFKNRLRAFFAVE